MRAPLRASLLAAAACLACDASRAALTENLGTNPIAMSMGNAVTADPPGVASIHYNPAGLTRLSGNVREDAFFGASVKPYASFSQPEGFDIGGWKDDPLNGKKTGPVRSTLFIPMVGVLKARLPAAVGSSLGLSFNKPGSPWTFATALYVTQGVGIDHSSDPDDPARYDGKKVVMQRLVYASPTVAYKWSDTLSFAVGVPIAHQGLGIETDMRMPNKLLGIMGELQNAWCGDNSNPLDKFAFGLCGDGGGGGRLRPFDKVGSMSFELTAPADPTLNLGVLWEPKPWFAAGAVLQTGSKTVLTGRYAFQAEPNLDQFVRGLYSSLMGPIVAATFGFPTSIPALQTGNATLVLPFPEHVQLGIKLKPLPRVQLNVDAGWTNWKRWDKFKFQFDQGIKLLEMARIFGISDSSRLEIPRGYRSTVDVSFGLQLQLTQALTLRAGYEPRKSSIPLNKMDLIAPLPDLTIRSLGLGYQWKEGTRIDAAISYASARFNLPAETSCNLNCSDFFNVIYNPYAGLDIAGGVRVRYFGIQLTHPF